jgi:hypothetical protein
MSYFQNFPLVNYKFGSETYDTEFQDLNAYVDIVDLVKDNIAFYQKYYIKDGDRPDNVSYELYGNTKYYWTFYLMNDNIREMGWPLDRVKLDAKLSSDFPNTVVTVREDLTGKFKVGSVVTGSTSNESGTILKRNLELGQIFIEGTKDFAQGEVFTTIEDGELKSITTQSSIAEKLAVHHYENADGEYVDIDPLTGPGNLITSKTYYDYYNDLNEANRLIKIIKPTSIDQIFYEFQNVMRRGR